MLKTKKIKKLGKIIDSKMIFFENMRNYFAKNYLADSLDPGSSILEPRTLFSNQIGEETHRIVMQK